MTLMTNSLSERTPRGVKFHISNDAAGAKSSRAQAVIAQVRAPGFDGMLWLSTTLWKRHCPWALPEPGEDLSVHEDLPLLRVVSVVQANRDSPAAALMRVRSLPADPARDLARWELVLGEQGWTPLPRL